MVASDPNNLPQPLSLTSQPPFSEYAREIDRCLPQTQCTQCDYPRCRDYAEAIAKGEAAINQCPPGGKITIKALSAITGQPVQPLNPDNGVEEPKIVAWIRESACIGCKLCIKACPVDCIIGAGKLMHTVISHDCTGCKLCIPVCPTDCIETYPAAPPEDSAGISRWPDFSEIQVERARLAVEAKLLRENRKQKEKTKRKIGRRREALQAEIADIVKRKRQAK